MVVGVVIGVIVGVVAVIGLGLWLVIRGRKIEQQRAAARDTANRMAQPRDPFAQEYVGGDPRELKLGDLVRWPGVSEAVNYAVRGTVTLSEDGYTWKEHFVDPIQGVKCYLSVDASDGDMEIVVWAEVDDFDIRPGQHQVAYDGVAYRFKEQGVADYTAVGTVNVPSNGQVEYMDYRGDHGRRLSFERFNGGKWELSIGEVIANDQLTIYPAA